MRRFKTLILSLMGLSAIVTAGSIVDLRLARAQSNSNGQDSAPVTIVGPLPVPVTTEITGTPTVNVASSEGNPVYVKDSAPAKIPFRHRFSFTPGPTAVFTGIGVYNIPANRRLEVEFVSCRGFSSILGQRFTFAMGGPTSSEMRYFVETGSFVDPRGGTQQDSTFNEKVLIHLGPGEQLQSFMIRNTGAAASWSGDCFAYGYEIPV